MTHGPGQKLRYGKTYSSLLYAITPNSLSSKGSLGFIFFAAKKYSSARFEVASWRCSMPMNRSGK